jgi:superfamily II DNA helicase RecQ
VFYSTLTLRFDPETSRFDDAPLDEFAKSREVLSVKDHFFIHGGLPHILLCVSWRMPPAGAARKPKSGEDWKGLLDTPEKQDRFDRLRRWRNETAKKEGKPAYAILTNRLAAEVAVLPSPSLTTLGTVDQFGPAKVEKYGRTILEVLGVAVDG